MPLFCATGRVVKSFPLITARRSFPPKGKPARATGTVFSYNILTNEKLYDKI